MSRDDYEGGWFGCKISGWPDNNAEWSRTFYTKTHESGIGTIWVSDIYGSGFAGAPNETTKKSAISGMLEKAKDDTAVDTWYMTWLNVRGTRRKTNVYNNYAADKINNYSQGGSYEKAGIVMVDWAGDDNYAGNTIIKAVIDNNFRAGGPTRKQ